MITLKNLSYKIKQPEEKTILSNINLEFPKGKITCITGHNGSGKSTLIKLIMGILQPTAGEIFYGDKKINNLNVDERAKLGITMAFQQPVRFKGLTVKDLIKLAVKNQTFEKEITLGEVCNYLSLVGLCAKDYVDRELDSTLSGGELKRIELAISLAKGGEVFLFDEPEAGIDLWSFESLVEIFKNLKDKTVIIVSHQKKILEIADYVLLLNSSAEAIFKKREDLNLEKINPQCSKLGGKTNA